MVLGKIIMYGITYDIIQHSRAKGFPTGIDKA